MTDGELTMERELATTLRRYGWLDAEFGPDDDGALAADIAAILAELGSKLVRVAEVTNA